MTRTLTRRRHTGLAAALAVALALTLTPVGTGTAHADTWQITYTNPDFAVRDSRTIDTFRIYDTPADVQLIIDNYRPCIITESRIYTRHRFVLERQETRWYWPVPRYNKVMHTDVPCAKWGPRYRLIEDLPPGKYRWRVFDARKQADGNTAVDVFTIVVRQLGGMP